MSCTSILLVYILLVYILLVARRRLLGDRAAAQAKA
jgi:hypothetical protein